MPSSINMSVTPIPVGRKEAVTVYNSEGEIWVQLRRNVASRDDINWPAFKVALPLTPDKAELLANRLLRAARRVRAQGTPPVADAAATNGTLPSRALPAPEPAATKPRPRGTAAPMPARPKPAPPVPPLPEPGKAALRQQQRFEKLVARLQDEPETRPKTREGLLAYIRTALGKTIVAGEEAKKLQALQSRKILKIDAANNVFYPEAPKPPVPRKNSSTTRRPFPISGGL
jgi:hypothetical protein